jgi:hypothetical protein
MSIYDETDPMEQERRWALIEMGLVGIQSQPDEIAALGIDPDTYEFAESR